jgi:DNA-binding LacI/PurR family transcriptional regulator
MSAREDIAQRVDALLSQNVCGMLIYPDLLEIDFEKFRYLRSIDFPFVFMSSDGKIYDLDTVYMDRRIGGYKATAHLAALGHKKIGFISGDKVKMEGYRQALTEYGLPFDERLIMAAQDYRCQAGYDAFAELYARHTGLSALFCTTDSYAIGAARYCRERGLKIPEDIAIVGYDNLEEARFWDVPITTISYDIEKETKMAIALLRKRIGEQSSQVKPENIALEPELIIRESTVKGEVHIE